MKAEILKTLKQLAIAQSELNEQTNTLINERDIIANEISEIKNDSEFASLSDSIDRAANELANADSQTTAQYNELAERYEAKLVEIAALKIEIETIESKLRELEELEQHFENIRNALNECLVIIE